MKKLIVVLTMLTVSLPAAWAGEWHIDQSLFCQDCHLQHASEDGRQLPGGPYSQLLLKNTINELCLSCHSSADPTAPDVQAPVQMYDATVSGESSAGFFGLIGIDNVMGHTLGQPAATPLQSAGTLMDLSCASCHAVHGNHNYRNLKYDPAGVGDSIILLDGADVFSQIPPDNPPTTAGSVIAYSRDNLGYRANYAAWCVTCHDQVAVNAQGLPPAHFNGHPIDVALNEFSGETHTDPDHWVAGIGEGFPAAGNATSYGIPRLPFEAPGATDFLTATEPAHGNEVFCGSCHYSHGGNHEKSLRWPYYEGGNTFLAGCQQCHNK